MTPRLPLLLSGLLACLAAVAHADDSAHLLRIDHYVPVNSTAPAMAGQTAQLYVREVVLPGPALRTRSATGKVLLFVHGAGTPAEVAFDTPIPGYSWMAFLAEAGFDVFSVDLTGYGRSSRPTAMNNPCNMGLAAQAPFVPGLLPAPCPPDHNQALTTIESDWHDIDAVVDHLRALRRVDRVSLLAWSQGGPRTGGYAARHAAKVDKLVVLAPAYTRNTPEAAPKPLATTTAPMTVQSQRDFQANWDRQVGCADQYAPAAAAQVWTDLAASDPVGATWGDGVRRAPAVPTWGFGPATVATLKVPILMVVGSHDKQVLPERVRELYADTGSTQKLLVELACSSHNAMWERNRQLLFQASLDWLRDGSVNGSRTGTLTLGN